MRLFGHDRPELRHRAGPFPSRKIDAAPGEMGVEVLRAFFQDLVGIFFRLIDLPPGKVNPGKAVLCEDNIGIGRVLFQPERLFERADRRSDLFVFM